MPGAERMLNDEEKEYFASRGEHEPKGYDSNSRESSEAIQSEQIAEDGRGAEESSAGTYVPDDESGQAETYESRVYDETEDSEHQQTNGDKPSKRDFEKAYGVAESKRQELRDQLEQQAKHNQYLQSQLSQVAQYFEKQKQQQQVPSRDEDPLGYYQHQLETMGRTVAEQQQYLRQQEMARKQQMQMQSFVNTYKAKANEFAQVQPDFKEAYNFIEQARFDEYRASGYSDAQAQQLLHEDEMAIAAKAFKDGVNPAERVYNLALARGFKSNNAPGKLDNVARGMEKGRSLPRAPSKGAERGFDMSRIDKMSDKDFDKLFNQVKEEAKQSGDYRKDFY